MQTVLDIITHVLDPLGIVVGLILAIPVFWTWYQVVWGAQRRYRRYLQAIRHSPGERPAIFLVDLLAGRTVRAAVENYRQQHPILNAIPPERIFHLERNGLDASQLHTFQADLQRLLCELYAQGVDRIHYFHAGPSMSAAMVGAQLSNGCPVWLYHFEGSGYQALGLLKPPVTL